MKVLFPQSCATLSSSVHGTLQARILEWVAMLFSGDFPTQGSNLGLLNVNMSYLDSERFGADLKQKHITDEEVALTMLLWKREYLVISYFCLCLGMIKKWLLFSTVSIIIWNYIIWCKIPLKLFLFNRRKTLIIS